MPESILSRPVLRLLAAISTGLLSLGLAPMAPLALAHSNEVSADPPADSVLDQAPDRVTLTFDEPLLDAGAALVVSAGDGTVVSIDPPLIDGTSISTALAAGVPGTFQVSYRVVSGDGHPVTGQYSFTVLGQATSPAEPTQGASPAEDSASPLPTLLTQEADPGMPNLMPIGLGLVALAALACVLVLAVRRRS